MLTRFLDAEVGRGIAAKTANRRFDVIAQVLKFAKKKENDRDESSHGGRAVSTTTATTNQTTR